MRFDNLGGKGNVEAEFPLSHIFEKEGERRNN